MDKVLYDGVYNYIHLLLVDLKIVSEEYPNGTPIPFMDYKTSGMRLFIDNQSISSYDDDLGDISWDNKGNVKVTSTTGVSSITKDVVHSISLVIYDPLHPESNGGQLLIHPNMSHSNLRIEVVNSKL